MISKQHLLETTLCSLLVGGIVLIFSGCRSTEPENPWVKRLGSDEPAVSEAAERELWASRDLELLEFLAAETKASIQKKLEQIKYRISFGLTPDDPKILIDAVDHFPPRSKKELSLVSHHLSKLSLVKRLRFSTAALVNSKGNQSQVKIWAAHLDSVINGMENRAKQRAGIVVPNAPGNICSLRGLAAQRELQGSLREVTDQITEPESQIALLRALRSRNSRSKIYSITMLDYRWNEAVPSSDSKRPDIRVIQALIDSGAAGKALPLIGEDRASITLVSHAIAFDPQVLERALKVQPPRTTAVSILVNLLRFPGWDRESGYRAAMQLEKAWKPRPLSIEGATKMDRDLIYYMSAASLQDGRYGKVLELADLYHQPNSVGVIGRILRTRVNLSEESLRSVIETKAAQEVRLGVLKEMSIAMGTMDQLGVLRFDRLSKAWFPTPHKESLPNWYEATVGLIRLRLDRDWPAAIEHLNRAGSDLESGKYLAYEMHNNWNSWKKEGRSPRVDVSLMKPDLFVSFLSTLGFQWELTPQNLRGYQLHIRGKELRWTLAQPKSEQLRVVRLSRQAQIKGDKQSQWELLQVATISRLTLFRPWHTKSKFSTRVPLSAYLAEARARGLIADEINRLEAYPYKKNAAMGSSAPVILTAALELARGDEEAAKQKLKNEKILAGLTLPSVEKRLEKIRSYVKDSQTYSENPDVWWSKWFKTFPSD